MEGGCLTRLISSTDTQDARQLRRTHALPRLYPPLYRTCGVISHSTLIPAAEVSFPLAVLDPTSILCRCLRPRAARFCRFLVKHSSERQGPTPAPGLKCPRVKAALFFLFKCNVFVSLAAFLYLISSLISGSAECCSGRDGGGAGPARLPASVPGGDLSESRTASPPSPSPGISASFSVQSGPGGVLDKGPGEGCPGLPVPVQASVETHPSSAA